MLAALSQEHFTDSVTNKQLAATRWDDAHSFHGETNNSLCFVETRSHEQLPSLLVDPTRMLKLEWFNNLQGSNLCGMSPLSCGCHRSGIIAYMCRARGPNASGPFFSLFISGVTARCRGVVGSSKS